MTREVWKFNNKKFAIWFWPHMAKGIAFPLNIKSEIRNVTMLELLNEGWTK